ncbi:helix-turn-helix domain-containing protein [Flavisolibacter sp. BT320]|nr:helix-turn-helix domain-containing protein [Flavisolibacter longurius]
MYMIYPAISDLIPLVKGLVQGLQPYAVANEVNIYFQCNTDVLVAEHHPYNLVQSLSQLLCQIINLIPHQSDIYVRLHVCEQEEMLYLEVENTGINLIPVNQINNHCLYAFTGQPLENGTLYRLSLPIGSTIVPHGTVNAAKSSASVLPRFYAEVRKRLRSHFTQAEMLAAVLSNGQPQEAAFLQKINALIVANLEHEEFDSNMLCKAMAMSRTQLFRRLKPLIRQAPAHYIKNMRLQKAKELLETTDLTIGEVTFKTGFQSQSHFTKIFLQRFGVLPSVFRKKGKPATNE